MTDQPENPAADDITLRDHFAAMSMAASLAMLTPKDLSKMTHSMAQFRAEVAKSAYRQADAMLKERVK